VKHRIRIPLEGSASSSWEVDAIAAGDGRFRIAGAVPRGVRPQYQRGDTVECEIRRLPDGSQAWVAIRSMTADPEFRKRRNVYAVCGAIIGGIIGAVLALQFWFSLTSAAAGMSIGALVFGFCSVRWGDGAWDALTRIFDPDS
jgi:hypothetical protein